MKRTPSIVDALRRESTALRSAPRRDLVPAVAAALARHRRARRRRVLGVAACVAMIAAAFVLPLRTETPDAAPDSPRGLTVAREPAPVLTLDPRRILHLGGAWWSGLEAPLRREFAGLTEDARKVASAVARRLPDSFSLGGDG